MTEQYFEDFAVGQTFGSGRLMIDAGEVRRCASEFDPQPVRVDTSAAHNAFFEGLVTSGSLTTALTMRLLVDSEVKPAGGLVGAGCDELRWPRAVRPGDELHLECEVLDLRPSKSRPNQGLIKLRTTTLNQNGEEVQILVANLVVRRRLLA